MKKFLFIILTAASTAIAVTAQPIIFTPNGNLVVTINPFDVNDVNMLYLSASEMEDLFIKENVGITYNSNYVEEDYSSNLLSQYNCHGFAWHMGGSSAATPAQIPDPSIYWKDFSYVETESDDPKATIVLYNAPGNYHSAIIPSTHNPDWVMSKWGETGGFCAVV